MKKIIAFLFFASLVGGCKTGLSGEDKLYIENQITVHQSTFGLKHKLDSLDREKAIMARNMFLGAGTAKKVADSTIKEEYKLGPNHIYSPQSDPYLNYEKFVEYCNKNHLDPKEQARNLITEENK